MNPILGDRAPDPEPRLTLADIDRALEKVENYVPTEPDWSRFDERVVRDHANHGYWTAVEELRHRGLAWP